MSKSFSIIVAATRKRGIGIRGQLPWPNLKEDMLHFKKLTSHSTTEGKVNAVIMGRKTWDSIPSKFRPLEGRINVVISGQAAIKESLRSEINTIVVSSLNEAMRALNSESLLPKVNDIFVIGGAQVYQEALKSDMCEKIYLTQVLQEFDVDTYLPIIDETMFDLVDLRDVQKSDSANVFFQILTYKRNSSSDGGSVAGRDSTTGDLIPSGNGNSNPEEMQYLKLIAELIVSGQFKSDRTGVGTISRFGAQMRFDLRKTFPLLTTKRVFWRGVAEELFWFIKGSTDAKLLQEKGVGIWDGNATREFLDKYGHGARQAGDLGPVYGFQWRHFGADYVDCHFNYDGKGVDQLADVIKTIRQNPDSRRIIMSAWNPKDLGKMALPPCHVMCQFYVHKGELSCQLYQRSCDMGLGIPFNIASYALLTVMVAHVTGLKPGDFIHTLGDAHVYSNHVNPLKEQLKRDPLTFPKLKINRDVKEIDDFCMEDFTLEGYKPYPTIKMDMAV